MNELIQYLKGYQAWRRGQDERTMSDAGINPIELGQMLDATIETLEAVSSNGPILVQERKIAELLKTNRELKQECDQFERESRAARVALGYSRYETLSPGQIIDAIIDRGKDAYIHVGYTNGANIKLMQETDYGAMYSNTNQNCYIPLYMLEGHLHRIETTGGDSDTAIKLQEAE